MSYIDIDSIAYSIFDPTGNITALVETEIPAEEQPAVAAAVMERHPSVEQVGFVRFDPAVETPVHLRMAGGEFCGNATMCAAALYLARYASEEQRADTSVLVAVAGVREPVSVDLRACMSENSDKTINYEACVHMPPVLSVTKEAVSYNSRSEELPCVREQGITHLVISDQSVFFDLLHDRPGAEKVIRQWCAESYPEGLGLMFLREQSADTYELTPLVCVPASGTTYWEHACASGSAACGIVLAKARGAAVNAAFSQPGGTLRVSCDPHTGEPLLYGKAQKIKTVNNLV